MMKIWKFSGYGFWLLAFVLFLYAYYPAHELKLLVEHWEFNDGLSQFHFNAFKLDDWMSVLFDTPFKDFRFIPGAYFCQFVTFHLFQNHFIAYLIANLSLHALNSVLLSLLVNAWRGRSSRDSTGFLAGAFFLVLPGCYETLIWTFFIYKVLVITLLLLCLLSYERYLRDGKFRHAVCCSALLFCMSLFYEALLPIGLALILGFFLLGREVSRRKVMMFTGAMAVGWILYVACYFASRFYVMNLLTMHQQVKNSLLEALMPSHLNDYLQSGFQWLSQSTFVDNLGFPLTVSPQNDLMTLTTPGGSVQFVPRVHHFFTSLKPDPNILVVLATICAWVGLWRGIRKGSFDSKRLGFALLLLFCGSVLVIVGRTLSNGKDYLFGMGIYHYFPSTMFALILGLILKLATEKFGFKSGAALASNLFLILILSASTRQVVSTYVELERSTLSMFAGVKEYIDLHPGKKIYVDCVLLRSPSADGMVSDEAHTYHVFHCLYGDVIVAQRNQADDVVTMRY